KLVQLEKFVDALAEFAAGYEMSHRALFLFNMGECARLSEQATRAREYYERYLAAEPNGSYAALAHRRLHAPDSKAAPPPRADDRPPAAPAPAAGAPPPAAHDTASPPAPPPKLPTPAQAALTVGPPPTTLVGSPEVADRPWWQTWPALATTGVV